jgi:arylsulfatase A-like enzyme
MRFSRVVRIAQVTFVLTVILALRPSRARGAEPQAARHPNIIFILSDDLGYGDCGCYGGTKIKTPNIDKLASRGLRFTDGHSTASTCTPSRYSIMTGQYAWRKKGTGILPGDASIIIPPGSVTLGGILQKAGYTTAAIGKWHLGLGQSEINWNVAISPGPNEVGFTYAFIIPATGDRVPCVFLENHNVVGLDPNDPIKVSYKFKVGNDPTGRENPELLKMKFSMGHDGTIVDGISRIGWMSGGHSARWVDEQIAKTLTAKATNFIEQNKDHPFFLYFATHDIHVPHAPDKEFAGSSECGIRGDTIQQLDWSVGQVMETLDRLKLAEDTLIVFSSDNGPVVDDGYADGSVEHLNGHKPAGALRGGKYSIYEGGTRIPFITAWSGHINPGTSDALVCQVDLLASVAAMTGQTLATDAAPDSFDVMPALLGQSTKGREMLIEQSGGMIALRKDTWKFIPRARPDGFREKNGAAIAAHPELYDLSKDISESKNVVAENPQVADKMRAAIAAAREQGRTRDSK